jgi:DNA processing protein
MANGVDAVCHRAALRAGVPTIAVMGTGPDQCYPTQHRDLQREIVTTGAVVSQFLPGVGPSRQNFPSRNAAIAGLGVATLVVEASAQSGALITAKQALSANRQVFAVPGPVNSPRYRGCHELIKSNVAKLVENVGDMLPELESIRLSADDAYRIGRLRGVFNAKPLPHKNAYRTRRSKVAREPTLNINYGDPDYDILWRAFDLTPTPMDTLISRSGLTLNKILVILSTLESDLQVINRDGRFERVVPGRSRSPQ